MLPSNWTSSYNIQYRDWRSRLLAPHPAEPMSHFQSISGSGYTDPSHARVSQGFWGQRASAAHTARGELSSVGGGLSATAPRSGTFSSGYSETGRAHSAPASSASSTTILSSTTSAAPADVSLAYRSAGYRSGPSTLPAINRDRRDLWGADIKPLSGTYYDFNYAPAPPTVPRFSADPTVHGVADAYVSAEGNSRSATAFIPGENVSTWTWREERSQKSSGGQDVRYDSGAVGQTKHVDWGRVSEPRNKFHIPGYQGFVRGILFQHGDTYGKTTRSCLDVPFDVPQEP